MLRLKEDSREVLVSHGDFVSSSFHGTTIVWSCFDTRREKKKNASGWVRGKGTSAVDGMWVFSPCVTLCVGLTAKGGGEQRERSMEEKATSERFISLSSGWTLCVDGQGWGGFVDLGL